MSHARPVICDLESASLRTDLPAFRVGDTVRVHLKIVEGDKERLQAFEGAVIRRRRGGIRATFTVRKVSYGVGVERTIPYCSPTVDHVEVLARGRVRRARLYYLRDRSGKAARIRERIDTTRRGKGKGKAKNLSAPTAAPAIAS